VLKFKTQQTSSPQYLSQHISLRSSTRNTRSSSVPLLCVPFRRTSFAMRSFSTAAPLTWNLTATCCVKLRLSTFKSRLTAQLFSTAKASSECWSVKTVHCKSLVVHNKLLQEMSFYLRRSIPLLVVLAIFALSNICYSYESTHYYADFWLSDLIHRWAEILFMLLFAMSLQRITLRSFIYNILCVLGDVADRRHDIHIAQIRFGTL